MSETNGYQEPPVRNIVRGDPRRLTWDYVTLPEALAELAACGDEDTPPLCRVPGQLRRGLSVCTTTHAFTLAEHWTRYPIRRFGVLTWAAREAGRRAMGEGA